MLDGHHKATQDRFWDRVVMPLSRTGVTPNQLTLLGTVLVMGSALAYVKHERAWILGVSVALLEMFDNLDGALARVSGLRTRFGAYLDAVTDRYKEVSLFGALAAVSGAWFLAFLCVSGSLLTSYAKARACMEAPLDNEGWPDLFERFERMAVLCTGLILSAVWPRAFGYDLVTLTLAVVALGTHFSALQRVLRARTLLQAHDRSHRQTR
jgi:archaetidylinositol phosphate synthase